jgi:adenosylcobinamide-phosphate synthase
VLPASGTALGLTLGLGLDRLLGDPRRGHPVAGFGHLAGALEGRLYEPSRRAGALHLAACLGAVGVPAVVVQRAARAHPAAQVAALAVVTWSVVGGRSLGRAAQLVGDAVLDGDLAAARAGLPSLCGRDPSFLDGPGLVRATVESVAENTSDAVVAPLLWGAVAGVPGLVLYRAVNTLDAMVGHRSPRYARFGTPAARLDDVLNYAPARLAAGLAVLLAPAVGGRPGDAVRAWRRDAPAHPSPNAGRVEAAFAGALGVRLGGPVVYPYGAEVRPTLGDGEPAEPEDVRRAERLSTLVGVASLAVGIGTAALLRRLTRPGG